MTLGSRLQHVKTGGGGGILERGLRTLNHNVFLTIFKQKIRSSFFGSKDSIV